MSKTRIEFDPLKLLRFIKKDKVKIIIFCLFGALFGLAVALGTPKTYKAGVSLAPESTSGSGLKSSLSSIASMVGMDMNFGNNNDAITPTLYPDVMKSTNFLVSLFNVKVQTLDGQLQTSYFDYLNIHQKGSWYNWPIEMFQQLMGLFSKDVTDGKRSQSTDSTSVNPFFLTKQQEKVASQISRNISCTVDKKTDVVSIVVTDQDPYIAALIADSVKSHLQDFITTYRTQKSKNDLEFAERIFEDSKNQYIEARQRYVSYSDANQDLLLETYKAKQEDLENDMQLKYNIYTQASEQLQISKAKLQESIPVFTVIQSPTVPLKHSSKGKVSTMLTYAVLAFILRMVILIWKKRKELIYLTED